MILALALSEDANFVNNLKQLEDVFVYTILELGELAEERPELENPDVVFLRATDPVAAIESVRSVRTELPDSLLILVEDLEGEVMGFLQDAGVWEILPRTTTLEQYQGLMKFVPQKEVEPEVETEPVAVAEPFEENKETRIVAVISPKGGVGKTSIATNLSIALALRHPKQVVLIDMDLQFGDVTTQLDLYPQQTIEHAIEAASSGDPLALKALLSIHSSGLYVVPGSVSPVTRDTLSSGQLSALIRQLARSFPYVIIDTGGGLDESTLVVLEESTAALFISTLDISSARGLRKEIDILKQLSLLPSQQIFVVNKNERNLALRPKDLEDAIGFSVALVIDREKEVSIAVNRGEPMFLTRTKSDFTKAIAALAPKIEAFTPTTLDEVY